MDVLRVHFQFKYYNNQNNSLTKNCLIASFGKENNKQITVNLPSFEILYIHANN